MGFLMFNKLCFQSHTGGANSKTTKHEPLNCPSFLVDFTWQRLSFLEISNRQNLIFSKMEMWRKDYIFLNRCVDSQVKVHPKALNALSAPKEHISQRGQISAWKEHMLQCAERSNENFFFDMSFLKIMGLKFDLDLLIWCESLDDMSKIRGDTSRRGFA